EGLPPSNDPPSTTIDKDLHRERPTIVVGGHRRTIRPGIVYGHDVTNLHRGQGAVAADNVAALANRADNLVLLLPARTSLDWLDAVERAVQRRPQQFRHACVENDELAGRISRLDVDDPR